MSVNAYILIQTEVGKAASVAAEIGAAARRHQRRGRHRPLRRHRARRGRDVDDLGKLVVANVQAVTGITRTLTCPVVHL